jgi:catalase
MFGYITHRSTTMAAVGRNKSSAKIHDESLLRGNGGELHQVADEGTDALTTAQGGPVADDQNTLKIGDRGPSLIEDFHFREKIFHFDHERIPERVVHARGYGAHGFFETYESLSAYTRRHIPARW